MDADIIRMAREACETTNWKPGLGNEHVVEFMARFAELIRADERIRFAEKCIDIVAFNGGSVEIEADIRSLVET